MAETNVPVLNSGMKLGDACGECCPHTQIESGPGGQLPLRTKKMDADGYGYTVTSPAGKPKITSK